MKLHEIFDKSFLRKYNLSYYDKNDFLSITKSFEDANEHTLCFCLTNAREKSEILCEKMRKNGAKLIFSNFDISKAGVVRVENLREVFSLSCKKFYNSCCDKMQMIAVSGTNGKTTTTHLIAKILSKNGVNVGIVGTSGVFYNGQVFDSPLTTPDADFLHKTFYEMRSAGVQCVVMEVSAHAIAQKRVDGILFDVGVLTNITQDHLDYFETMENYEKTKLSFFTKEHIKNCVVCVDDERAKKVLDFVDVPTVTYGLKNPADTFAIDVCCSLCGTHFVANVCDEVLKTKNKLVGEYNVYNTLASLSVCKILGLDGEKLRLGAENLQPIEGRFNVIPVGDKYAIVDYAHSPDGLYSILNAVKSLATGKVFVVFGCGGNRDKGKRSQMGEIAEKYADVVCLTDDNPRWENSMDIISDIEKGMKKGHFVEPNRSFAIKSMLGKACVGDIVVIAGKGAEKYQETRGEKKYFSDFDVVYDFCKKDCCEKVQKNEVIKDLKYGY